MGRFGTLILLGLPIGNPKDLTTRVYESLKEAKYLICEDTRKLKFLLKYLEISLEGKKILSFHDHSSDKKLKVINEMIETGENVYYCSDAGSPIISDPAYELVQYCLREKIKFNTFSGVSSVITGLELSGLPPIPFSFHGFLPRDKKEIIQNAQKVLENYGTHIFFESKHRLHETLILMGKSLPLARFVVLREMTKEYQSVYRFLGRDVSEKIEEIEMRGEFIFIVHNDNKEKVDILKIKDLARKCLEKKGKKKVLSQLLANVLDLDQNEVFINLSES